MLNKNKNLSKTFCILPWTHVATYNDGSALLCCVAKNTEDLNLNKMTFSEVWNSDHFKDARIKMLNGERVSACESCYKEEDAGVRSHRQVENHVWIKELGEEYINSIIDQTQEDGTVLTDMITLDLRLGNTCNLQCLMCRPRDSSKWLKDARILSETLQTDAKWDWKYKIQNYSTNEFNWYKDLEFLNNFYESANDIRHIIFGGGEPLYIKEHHEIIKELVKRGLSKNIKLRYHTNGTILNEEIIELWNQFQAVELMISIDGYDQINSIIRFPSVWEDIEENLKRYDKTEDNITVKILCTVQALNIMYLPEFIDWIKSQNYKKIVIDKDSYSFHCGTLHWPQYMTTKILPKELKEIISTKLISWVGDKGSYNIHKKVLDQISFMNSEDDEIKQTEFLEYIEKIDILKDLKIKETMPEFFSFFKK
jgi:MoaA/NifB/PqqE/SkfB family radical SAM enzyme